MRGDCLTCSKVASCQETSLERVLWSYTCPLFDPVPEEVYQARITVMQKFGERYAIEAMLARPPPQVDEESSHE